VLPILLRQLAQEVAGFPVVRLAVVQDPVPWATRVAERFPAPVRLVQDRRPTPSRRIPRYGFAQGVLQAQTAQ
jgi:hypothetical protein